MSNSPASTKSPSFLWLPSLVGGMAAAGIAATLGTLVSSASLWMYLARGLTVQEAYGRMSELGFASPTEFISLLVLVFAGFAGGYSSALYGGSNRLLQAFVAGVVSTLFFVSMSIGPATPPVPFWYAALHFATLISSSLVGVYLHTRNAQHLKVE